MHPTRYEICYTINLAVYYLYLLFENIIQFKTFSLFMPNDLFISCGTPSNFWYLVFVNFVCFCNQTFPIARPSKVVADISWLFTHLLWLGACPNAAHIGTTFFVIVILRTDIITLREKLKMLHLSQHLSQGVDTDCSSYSSAVNASASSPQTHLPTDITQNSKPNQSWPCCFMFSRLYLTWRI